MDMELLELIRGVFSFPALGSAAWGFLASFIFSLLIVLTKGWHGALSIDNLTGVQKFHSIPTPRIGGLAVVIGVVVAWANSPEEIKEIITPILVAGSPAFIVGFSEDITKCVGVMPRLLATMVSGLMAWWITDYSLNRVDVWGIDVLLQFTCISVLFTSIAISGIANSINIIDGFNGLASNMCSIALIGLALIAWQANDTQLSSAAIVLTGCVWGFFWVNWPLGKIFLGDGGAYFIGFGLAWIGVLLVARNPSVTAFAPLLICAHPVTEVIFSIYRRQHKRVHPGHPDKLHLHSLIKQRFVRKKFPTMSNLARNSITGILMGGCTLITIAIACFTYKSTWLSILAYILFVMTYIAIYGRLVRYRW